MSISWNFFKTRLTAFLHATSNSLTQQLSKDHNSQPYLLLKYALKSFVQTQPDSLLKKHSTLLA